MSYHNHGTQNADAIVDDQKIASVTADNHGFESSDDCLDDNYRAFKATENLEVDPAGAKRVVRKIDWRIVTVLFVTYMLQYLDKSELLPRRLGPLASPKEKS